MIIGLTGYARVGKNEAANGLVPLGWEIHAFADKLREVLYTLNPMVEPGVQRAFGTEAQPARLRDIIDQYDWNGYKQTPYNGEIRRLIQTMGTECGRGLLGQNVWVDATLKDYWASCQWIIPDVRFPNEVNAIEALGGTVIRVSKPGVGPLNNHESETALESSAFLDLSNDGSVDDLHTKMRYYVKYMI